MPQSLSMVYVHGVFSTHNRIPFLTNADLRNLLHGYIGEASKRLDCPPVAIGGTGDHVHLLCRLGRRTSQAVWIKEVKRVSCVWIRRQDASPRDFGWQGGYGTFSVSASMLDDVRDYVRTQENHHATRTFQDEFRALLRKHMIEWDERYVWG